MLSFKFNSPVKFSLFLALQLYICGLFAQQSKIDSLLTSIIKELDSILERLIVVSSQKTEPDIKLTNHILTHLDAVKDVVNRNGSLRADFFHDIYEVERKRRKNDVKEISLIRAIISEGIEKNIFNRMDADLSSTIIFYAIKGLEVPYIRQNISSEFEKNKNSIVDFVFIGIKKNFNKINKSIPSNY